jgi:hypothetical protein
MLLIQVHLSHLCAGVVAKQGVIIEAAPILSWAVGKTPQQLAAWALKRKGAVTVVRRWREANSG